MAITGMAVTPLESLIKYDYLPQRREGRKEKHEFHGEKTFALFAPLR